MTTKKSESPAQEKKEEVVKPSKKKEQYHHQVSESPRSIPFNASKPLSAPTLQDSFNNSFSDGDLQMVVASHSHSHSHSHSVSDGAIKVVNEEQNSMSMVAVMDMEEVVEEGTCDDVVSKKEVNWYIVLLGLRIAAFVFCKIAFSVMAADKGKKVMSRGSSTDHWSDYFSESSEYSETQWYYYKEFKYCLSVNVIGFVYSALQICDLVKYFLSKRHTMDPKLRGYFNFAMDQGLAYLLISASSSAATTASYWTSSSSNADKFVEMANASIALSFVAFVAFASSSIVSAFIFCRFN